MDSKTSIKDKLSKLNKSLFNRQEGRFVKAAMAALIITTLTFNLAFAKEDILTFDQVYHVYVGNEYMGSVSSEETINELVAKKEEEASMQYEELSIDASSHIKVIPELVYKTEINESETLEKLDETITAEAQAYALTVNGETVAYLKDAIDYEDVLNQIKLQYVTQEQLDELKKRKLYSTDVPPLALNETRILEVLLKEEVSGSETKILPDQILPVEDALELLTSGSIEKVLYEVQSGDVLGAIANKHGLKLEELFVLNPDITEDTILKIGQQLNVTAVKPFISVVVAYETLVDEVIDFEKVSKDDNTLPKGETKVIQTGVEGKKQANYRLEDLNGVYNGKSVISEKILVEPIDQITHIGTKIIPARGTGSFGWPASGGYISSKMGSRWGAYHRGIDIAKPSNYTIKASDNGRVTFVGRDGTYGNKIIINHNNGYETVYAHLSSMKVQVGQVVSKGAAIGVMGSTGRSTGVHLHFEVHKNGSYVNPLAYLE